MSRVKNTAINAFANPVRLKLLCCLSKGKMNVRDLIGNCNLAQSAVSQHLSKLKKEGFVKDERVGKYIFYSLTDPKAGLIAKELGELVRSFEK